MENLHISILSRELERRKFRNPRYSLRAFARSLGVDPGDLSRFLGGKKAMPLKVGLQVSRCLGLVEREELAFIESIFSDWRRNAAMPSELPIQGRPAPERIDHNDFSEISDPIHYQILELTQLDNFVADSQWVASRLGVDLERAEAAIKRLFSLGMLTELKTGQWQKTHVSVTTSDKSQTNDALKQHQQAILEGAIKALWEQSIESRSMTGMTMPIDPARMPLAKAMIQQFMEDLCLFMGAGKREDVYQLCVAFYKSC